MFYVLVTAGGLIILTLVIAVVLVLVNSRAVSIENLKSQNRVKDIINILQDDRADLQRRKEAITALADIGTPEATRALLDALSTRHGGLLDQLAVDLPRMGVLVYPGLRKAFMKAVSRPGVIRILTAIGPSSVEVLIPLIKDPNLIVKSASIQAFDQVGWKPGKDLTSVDYWIAKRRPELCAEIGPLAVPALLEALSDPGLVLGAIDALGAIEDPAAGWPLLKISKDPKYKIRVIKSISRWKEKALPFLLAALKHDDPQIRQTAVNILDLIPWRPTPDEMGARYWILKRNWERCADIGSAAVIPLLEVLHEKDKSIQIEAIRTLGKIADQSALEGLLSLFEKSDKDVRRSIIETMGSFKQPQGIELLINHMSEDSLAGACVQAFVQIGRPAVAVLVKTLSSKDQKMRARAAETLAMMGWAPVTDLDKSLFSIARQDWEQCIQIGAAAIDLLIGELQNEQTCVNAAQALIKIGDSRVIKPILQSLVGKPAAIQHSIADALGGMGAPVVEPLLEELEHGNIDVVPIIQALGESRDERAARPLTQFLKDSYSLSVRDGAALALGKIGLPALDPIFDVMRGEGVNPRAAGVALGGAGLNALDRLISALKSKVFDAQVLVYALGKIPNEESARAILSTLQSTQYGQEIRDTAQEALFEIGEPAIRPTIDGYVRSPDNEAIFTSILLHFGPMAVEPLVWSLGSSYNPGQIEAIVNVLGEIGDIRAVNPLVNMLKRNNINTKLVNEALEKIWRKQRLEKERFRK